MIWQNLDTAARRLVPVSTVFLLILIGALPVQIPHYGAVAPMLSLCGVVYWTLSRPQLMPASIAFVLGLIQDIVGMSPMGLHALLYVVAWAMVDQQRKFLYGRPFILLWLSFCLVVVVVQSLAWTSYSLLHMIVVAAQPAIVSALLTMTAFPVVATIAMMIDRALVSPLDEL